MTYQGQGAGFSLSYDIVEVRGYVEDGFAAERGVKQQPLENTCVGVFTDTSAPKLIRSVKIRSDGKFSFPDVRPGPYRLAATFPGFCPTSARIQVRSAGNRRQHLKVSMTASGIDSCSGISLRNDPGLTTDLTRSLIRNRF